MKSEREINYTFTLLFSVAICVIGNSFLYGYNIGVVNNPAGVIRVFYVETIMIRRQQLPENWFEIKDQYLEMMENMKMQNLTVTSDTNATASGNGTGFDIGKVITQIKVASMKNDKIELLWSVTVAIFVLFGMIGAFTSGKFADYFGRKKGMIIITVIMFLAAICGGIPIVARSFEVIIVHRALVGLHCGLNVSLASLYLAEISPKKIRGAIGTCHQLFITIGILWSNIMGVSKLAGNHKQWPWVFIFNAFPAFICLVAMPFCPESPRYLLINRGDEETARHGLKDLRGYLDVEDEIDEMKVEARKSQSVKEFSLKELLTSPELRVPIIIACCLQIAQQFSGINAVMSFSSFMYENAGVDLNLIEWIVCLTSLINMLTTIPAVPMIEKLGRRPLLLFPMGLMALSFIVLTIFHNLQYNTSLQDSRHIFAIIGIIAMHTYVIGFAVGLGPIPFIVVGEIFRQEPRAAAMSLSLTFNWICNFILMMVFRFMQKAMLGFVYLPFIGVLVLAIAFIWIMVPETKNKTFDQISSSIHKGGRNQDNMLNHEGEELQSMKA
ncbi:solute carrier family 2, facilitated glucose transporter member 1-like [Mytilus californianus]|uniref:solute carrier family 2, facilitated glucose transporter member 1-like n=1 Tax=Mytilus californianus TaxID=6549 RepID=UPI0022483A1C|nr:solute carrier family 2, facilitated glucose transporter member 1-like [Mytilus californianus]